MQRAHLHPAPSVSVHVLVFMTLTTLILACTVRRILLSSISRGDVHLKAVKSGVNSTPEELIRREWEAVFIGLLGVNSRHRREELIQTFRHRSYKNSPASAAAANYLNALKSLYTPLLYRDVLWPRRK